MKEIVPMRWKFTLLLVSLLVLLVLYPLLRRDQDLQLVYEVLLVAVFGCSLLVLFQHKHARIAALLLGIPTIGGLLSPHVLPDTPPVMVSVLFHFLPVLFLGLTVVTILKTIFVNAEVSTDSINGAFCGYLLIGLAFGHLYCLTESVHPGSFRLQECIGPLPPEGDRRHFLLTYFSLITLTTVGYGDITPLSPPARSLAWVEAMLGQFYIGVIIAELIGMKVSATIREGRTAATDQVTRSHP